MSWEKKARGEALLRVVHEAGTPVDDRVYFRSLVRHLAQATGARYTLIATREGRHLRLLVRWAHERFLDELECPLSATPFAALVDGDGDHAAGVADPALLAPIPVPPLHFVAVPLLERSGQRCGLVAALDESPFGGTPEFRSLLRFFAERAAAGLERLHAARARDASDARSRDLAAILGCLRETGDLMPALHELARLGGENEALRRALDAASGGARLLGESAPMRALEAVLAALGSADATVLIQGEAGTGKALVAQAIHARSRRAGRVLVTMSCAALPAAAIESELFGATHAAGTRRKGRFELADGGSLFLDEVGELPVAAQAKLLRLLQERRLERDGGGTVQVDVRLLAATNRDLGAMVRAGAFRADLYDRLQVSAVAVPPLRERGEDVFLLARHFLVAAARRCGKPLEGFTPESEAQMRRYAWPGNVRELRNVVERAAMLATSRCLDLRDLLDPGPA